MSESTIDYAEVLPEQFAEYLRDSLDTLETYEKRIEVADKRAESESARALKLEKQLQTARLDFEKAASQPKSLFSAEQINRITGLMAKAGMIDDDESTKQAQAAAFMGDPQEAVNVLDALLTPLADRTPSGHAHPKSAADKFLPGGDTTDEANQWRSIGKASGF